MKSEICTIKICPNIQCKLLIFDFYFTTFWSGFKKIRSETPSASVRGGGLDCEKNNQRKEQMSHLNYLHVENRIILLILVFCAFLEMCPLSVPHKHSIKTMEMNSFHLNSSPQRFANLSSSSTHFLVTTGGFMCTVDTIVLTVTVSVATQNSSFYPTFSLLRSTAF